MALSEYWNPRHETLPRGELEELQLRRLRSLIAWARRTPFHAERLPASIDSLDDLRRLPLMTRDDWMRQQGEGFAESFLAAPRERAIRYHRTSGTTGRTPIRVLDSPKDWDWIAEMWCYGLWGFGVRPSGTVYLAFTYGTFIGFWGCHYGAEKIGALVVPGGGASTQQRLEQILDTGATVVCATPTYALRLAQEAERLGLDLPGSPVERLILSGEPAGSIPATKALIERKWGAKAGDTAGMTELGTIMIFECEHQPGGTHIIEDHYIEEVVDPDSGEPVGYGEQGERVVTSFGRGFLPLIRYRTGDLVVRVPASRCSCGRGFDLYDGGIRGRIDDMKLVRGTNVYPSSIEAIVRERDEVDEFQIRLYTREGIRDEIEVLVELPGTANAEPLLSELATDLSKAHGGLRIGTRVAEPSSLPRFDLKAKRIKDERVTVGEPA